MLIACYSLNGILLILLRLTSKFWWESVPVHRTTPILDYQVICTQGFLLLAFGDPTSKRKAATLSCLGRGPSPPDLAYRSFSFPPYPSLWSSSVTMDKEIALYLDTRSWAELSHRLLESAPLPDMGALTWVNPSEFRVDLFTFSWCL